MTVQMDPGGPQLLMLLFVLSTVVLLISIAVRAIRHRPLGRLAAILASLVIVYSGCLLGFSLWTKAADLGPGDLKCFDEWCAGMVSATASPGHPGVVVRVRLANHGRQPQRSLLARAFIETGSQRIWPHNPEALQTTVLPGVDTNVDLNFDTLPTGKVTRFVVTEAVSGSPTPASIVIGDESSPFHPIIGWPLGGVAPGA